MYKYLKNIKRVDFNCFNQSKFKFIKNRNLNTSFKKYSTFNSLKKNILVLKFYFLIKNKIKNKKFFILSFVFFENFYKKFKQDFIKDNKLIFSFEINDSISIILNFLFILSFNILFTFLLHLKAKIICLKFRTYNSNKRFQNENKTIINDFGSFVIKDFKKIEKSNKRLSILEFLKRNSIKFIFINFFAIILDFKSSILPLFREHKRSIGSSSPSAKLRSGKPSTRTKAHLRIGSTSASFASSSVVLAQPTARALPKKKQMELSKVKGAKEAKGVQQNKNSNHIFFIKNLKNWKINKNKRNYLKFFCLKKKELFYFMFFQHIYYYINLLFHFYCFSFKKIQYIILIKTFLIKHSSKKKVQFFHYAPSIFHVSDFASGLHASSLLLHCGFSSSYWLSLLRFFSFGEAEEREAEKDRSEIKSSFASLLCIGSRSASFASSSVARAQPTALALPKELMRMEPSKVKASVSPLLKMRRSKGEQAEPIRRRAKERKHANASERKQTAKFFNKISLNNNMFFLFNNKNFLNNMIFEIYNKVLFLNNYFSIFINLKYNLFRMHNLIKSNTFKFFKLIQNIYNIKLLLKFQKIFYCIEMTYFLSKKKFYNKTKKFLFFKIQKLLWNCFILKKKSFLPLYSIIFSKKKYSDFYYHFNDNIFEKESVLSIFIKKKLLFFCYPPFFCKVDKRRSNSKALFHSFTDATSLIHSYYAEAKESKPSLREKRSKGIDESKIASLLASSPSAKPRSGKPKEPMRRLLAPRLRRRRRSEEARANAKSNKKIEIILGPLKFGLSFELYCNIFSFYTYNSFIKQSIKTIKSNFLFYDCLNFYKKKFLNLNNYSCSSFVMLLKTSGIKDSNKAKKKQRKSEALKQILVKKNVIYTLLSKKQNLVINNENFFSVLKKLIEILKQIRPFKFILHLKRYIFFTKNFKNFTFFNIILKTFYPYYKTSNFILNSSEIENYLKSKIFFLIIKFTKMNMLFLKKNTISFFISELQIQNNFLAILLYTWLLQNINEHTQTNSIISNYDTSKYVNQKILNSYNQKDALQMLLHSFTLVRIGSACVPSLLHLFCFTPSLALVTSARLFANANRRASASVHISELKTRLLSRLPAPRLRRRRRSEELKMQSQRAKGFCVIVAEAPSRANKQTSAAKESEKGSKCTISSDQEKNNKKEKNEDIKLYNIGFYYGSFLLNFNINIFDIVEILYKNFYISFLKIQKPKLFKIRLIKSHIRKNKYSFKTYIINLFKYKFFKSVLKKLCLNKKIKEKKYIKSIFSLHTKYKKSLKSYKNLFLYDFKKFFFNYSFFTIYKNFQINKIQNKSKFFLIKKWDPLKSKHQKISNYIWKKNKISFFYETNYLNIFNNSKFSNCLITDKNNLFVLNSKYTIINKFADATIAWYTKFNISHQLRRSESHHSLSQKKIDENKKNIFYLKKRKILSLEEMYSLKKNGLNFKGFFLFLRYVSNTFLIRFFFGSARATDSASATEGAEAKSKKERFNTKEFLIIDKKGCLIKKQIFILKHHKVQNFHQFFFCSRISSIRIFASSVARALPKEPMRCAHAVSCASATEETKEAEVHFHFSSLEFSNHQSKIYKPKTQQKTQYFNFKINTGLIPSKKNIKKHLNLLKNIILKYNSQAQKKLLYKLSYRIINWSYYYKIVINSQLFYYCDKIIYKLLWKWACRNHPNKNKKWIQQKYFFSLKNKKWVFGILPKNFDSKSSRKDIFYLPSHNFLIKI
uniref:Orf1819 n=1 Tax=Pediastrum duplex TaxID=3105 RepID=A0A344PFK5_PEDDU|nr:orf1819 [Pediastrum duplex]QFS20071.1 hypothetical protein [Pediastrum duplex]